MAKLSSKERELILAELDARLDEIRCNESQESFETLGLEYEEDEGYSRADVRALERGIDKLRELFEVIYG